MKAIAFKNKTLLWLDKSLLIKKSKVTAYFIRYSNQTSKIETRTNAVRINKTARFLN